MESIQQIEQPFSADDYFYRMILDFSLIGWADMHDIHCAGLPSLPMGHSWYLPFMHDLQRDDWVAIFTEYALHGLQKQSITNSLCPSMYDIIPRALANENAHSQLVEAMALRIKTKI